jgi:uncharacterized membrane protein
MRFTLHPAWLCAALYLLFLAAVAASQRQLPERLATHFDRAGEADGWATREQWRTISLAGGTALPLVAVALFWIVRLFPAWAFNIPRRDYWLGPEQRSTTFGWFTRHGWWLACLELFLFIGIEWVIVRANRVSPPQLVDGPILIIALLFVAGLGVWAVQMVRRFRRLA